MKHILLALILFISISCEITDERDTVLTLNETEEATLLRDEISEANGGFMNDLLTAYNTASTDFYASSKASIDTSFSYKWYQLDVSLSFFKSDGTEQAKFVPNLPDLTTDDKFATDSIAFVAAGSGSTQTGNISLDLNHRYNFQMTNLVSNQFQITGKGVNDGSIFELKTRDSTLTVHRFSNYEITEALIINHEHDDFIPESGTIKLNFKSDIQLISNERTKNLTIDRLYTITFKSSEVITLSLSTGRTVRINLISGEITLG